MRRKLMVFIGCILFNTLSWGLDFQKNVTDKSVFIITLDGYRWQELFKGADQTLIGHENYVEHADKLKKEFWHESEVVRRKKLMPFVWTEVEKIGQIYGNRELGSVVKVTNPYHFSYPGYSEILVGYVDKKIDSNGKINNPNITVLEFVNDQPQFKGRVAAFASWHRFPEIINEKRSGIPVNASFENALGDNLSALETHLNVFQHQLPKIWDTVRYDALTHQYAKEYIKKNKPNLVYISYGETDEFAHSGEYGTYLRSTKQTDALLKDLWDYVQSDAHYNNKTTFIITTDHGRGSIPIDTWRSHGEQHAGADQTWLIAFGAGVKAKGEISNGPPIFANQIASTVAQLLGLDYKNSRIVGEPVGEPIRQLSD